MSIGDIISAVTVGILQPMNESRMADTVVITRPGEGPPVWDEDSQSYVPPTVEVYSGPCAFSSRNPAPQEADAGEANWAVDRTPTIKLPASDPRTADVQDGHTGTITATGPRSAAKAGLTFTILTGHWQTDSTARRIPVQVVTRDAG